MKGLIKMNMNMYSVGSATGEAHSKLILVGSSAAVALEWKEAEILPLDILVAPKGCTVL